MKGQSEWHLATQAWKELHPNGFFLYGRCSIIGCKEPPIAGHTELKPVKQGIKLRAYHLGVLVTWVRKDEVDGLG